MPERRPFDPSKARAVRQGQSSLPTSPGRPLTVLEVNELLRGAIARCIPATLHVVGEIGNLSTPTSGHVYFALKDARSELRCVMWRSSAERLKFRPEVGMEVIATGGIEVYTPRGAVQLIVRKLEPRGAGALEIAFRQLREKLEREGLFDPARRRPIPRFPRTVALVTSPSGAAIRDILHTLHRRFPALEVLLFPVRVQGAGAAEEIAAAIRLMNRYAEEGAGIDVAVVGRGGGSLEDLWAFNTEVVARAIAASRVPIVSAVGHEVDISISDLVADLRAPTPTAAAELITPRLDDLLAWLDRAAAAARRAARQQLALAQARLHQTLSVEAMARPLAICRLRAQRLDEQQRCLDKTMARRFGDARERTHAAERAALRYGLGSGFAPVQRRLRASEERLAQRLAAIVHRAERAAGKLEGRLSHCGPDRRLPTLDERLAHYRERVASLLRARLRECRQRLGQQIATAQACHPRRVLERGFSITRDAKTRRILRSAGDIRDRMRIVTELAEGEFRSTADDPRQPGLFDGWTDPAEGGA